MRPKGSAQPLSQTLATRIERMLSRVIGPLGMNSMAQACSQAMDSGRPTTARGWPETSAA